MKSNGTLRERLLNRQFTVLEAISAAEQQARVNSASFETVAMHHQLLRDGEWADATADAAPLAAAPPAASPAAASPAAAPSASDDPAAITSKEVRFSVVDEVLSPHGGSDLGSAETDSVRLSYEDLSEPPMQRERSWSRLSAL